MRSLTVYLQVIMSVVHSCPVWSDTGITSTVRHLDSSNPERIQSRMSRVFIFTFFFFSFSYCMSPDLHVWSGYQFHCINAMKVRTFCSDVSNTKVRDYCKCDIVWHLLCSYGCCCMQVSRTLCKVIKKENNNNNTTEPLVIIIAAQRNICNF